MTAFARRPDKDTARQMARGLGWFSIGLGLAACVAPRGIARAVGLPENSRLVQAVGIRELLTGVGILGSRDQAPWIRGRFAGDIMDLSFLAAGLGAGNPDSRHRSRLAMLAVAQVTAADLLCLKALNEAETAALSRLPRIDYSARSGFSAPSTAMRGAALDDFQMPADMGTPQALRPWN